MNGSIMLQTKTGSLSHLLKIYVAHFKVWIALQFQYRVAMIIWLLGLVIQPIIYMIVWANVAEANGGDVDGLTAGDFAAYFIAAMIVNHLAYTWHMWEYDYIIRQGKLSPRLLRPMHPIHADIAENISFKVLTMIVMVPTTIALILSVQSNLESLTLVVGCLYSQHYHGVYHSVHVWLVCGYYGLLYDAGDGDYSHVLFG